MISLLLGIPKPIRQALVWAVAIALAVGSVYLIGRSDGKQREIEKRQEAAQEAKERSDEIDSEVDRRDDDALVDGILRP